MRIRWTLRKKILIGYGINLGLMLVALLWAMGSFLMFQNSGDPVSGPNFRSIIAAGNLIGFLERQDSGMLLFLLGYERKGLEILRNSESGFLQWLGRAKDSINLEGEAGVIESIEQQYTDYLIQFSRLQEMRSAGEYLPGDFYMRALYPAQTAVRDLCLRLREMNLSDLYGESSRSRALLSGAIISTAIIGISLIIIGLSFSFFLSNILVEPLKELVSATQSVSEGNYHVTVRTRSSDELGTLGTEFNTMVDRLRGYNDMNIEQIVSEKHKNDAIIRSIEDGIIVIDSEYRIMNINPIAAAILTVNPDIVHGRHLLEVVGNRELFDQVRRSMETGSMLEFAGGRNILSVHHGGVSRHYLLSIASVHARTESMVGVVLLFKDVTKIKELDDLKTEFVMTASHELRTPLASIELGVKLIQEKMDSAMDAGEREVLSAVQEEVQRLKNLVNDLLDLSRIESGKLELHRVPVNTSLLCAAAVENLKRQAEDGGVSLVNAVERDSVPDVFADRDKAGWVLINLIGNALKYTTTGGRIEIRADTVGSFVQVSVSDTGSGIPYEFQSKIFDKFVRIKDDGEHRGTGLGLSICKELVHAHGGAIWVESKPGEGSTFLFTLPVSRAGIMEDT